MAGTLVILSGPSGVGKDTVIDAWREADPCVERVVAYTTRPPREGEQDGVDYHFVTVDAFLAQLHRTAPAFSSADLEDLRTYFASVRPSRHG